MKKLLLSSVIFLGAVSLAAAQDGKGQGSVRTRTAATPPGSAAEAAKIKAQQPATAPKSAALKPASLAGKAKSTDAMSLPEASRAAKQKN